MSHMPNEDLFEHTKMSFGEHLEELRVALFRSLVGLLIGFLIGLGLASMVVRLIKDPLTVALEDHYFTKSTEHLEAEYGAISKELKDFMRQNNLVFEEGQVEWQELQRLTELFQSRTGEHLSTDTQLAATDTAPPHGRLRGDAETNGDATPSQVKESSSLLPGPPSSEMVRFRIWRPLSAQIKTLNAHEAFMIWLKAALITGAVISSPWVFWQIWNFVAAGLYPHEKSYVHIFLPFSLGLFLSGAALAFFFVFEPVLEFLFSFNKRMNIDPDPRISEWMSFVLFLPLGFGLSFQLPLIMLLLERIGVMTIASYLSKWRTAVLGIFVLAMMLTPADPVSMLLMAIPLTLLYFGGIGLCRWMPKRKSPYGEGYDPA